MQLEVATLEQVVAITKLLGYQVFYLKTYVMGDNLVVMIEKESNGINIFYAAIAKSGSYLTMAFNELIETQGVPFLVRTRSEYWLAGRFMRDLNAHFIRSITSENERNIGIRVISDSTRIFITEGKRSSLNVCIERSVDYFDVGYIKDCTRGSLASRLVDPNLKIQYKRLRLEQALKQINWPK